MPAASPLSTRFKGRVRSCIAFQESKEIFLGNKPSYKMTRAARRNIVEVESVDDIRRLCPANTSCSLLKFGAKWCGPCQEVRPKVQSWLAEEAPECIAVFEADADEA